MSIYRIASRYAKSVLDLALEQDSLEEVLLDMKRLESIGNSNSEFSSVIKSPVIPSDKKLNILKALFPDGNRLTLTFFDIIIRKERVGYLLDIAKAFQIQYNEYKNIQVAEVTTTYPLDEEQRNKFKKVVSEISKKEQVELKEKVDENIIGGFVLKIGDRQLDESIKSKLKSLQLMFSHDLYEKQF
ncbi:ATP synthase F1 subunit delta [Anditalea andensis]|uniref:ATP synthase subunit delta n=1 Tax=Anditalea andensis TaxID=1048983 RepID=A0A074KXX9_9BACT|nr:ATP synthase F1 subunit delta [Anditalea andensis]KEO73060.1 ATP synthase F1 subunit delta [Anditalea andensis]